MRRRMQAGLISCRANAGSPRKTEPPLQDGESLVQFKFFTGDQNFRYQSGPLIVSNARSIDLRCGAFDGIGVDDAFRLITRRNGIETPRAILAKDAGDNRARGEFRLPSTASGDRTFESVNVSHARLFSTNPRALWSSSRCKEKQTLCVGFRHRSAWGSRSK